MNSTDLQKHIEQQVLSRIGSVRMHSRSYFFARALVAALLGVLVLLLSALVLSFIAFSIHESGEQFLLGFGWGGLSTFVALFPWLLLALDIALVALLEWLVQGFKIGYRVSLTLLFLGACALAALIAALVNLTPLHAVLLDRADRGELPIVGNLYENIRASHQDRGIFRGSIISIADDRIVIAHNDGDRDADDGTRTVFVPQGATSSLYVGERVYVFGTASGEEVQAYGVGEFGPAGDGAVK